MPQYCSISESNAQAAVIVPVVESREDLVLALDLDDLAGLEVEPLSAGCRWPRVPSRNGYGLQPRIRQKPRQEPLRSPAGTC